MNPSMNQCNQCSAPTRRQGLPQDKHQLLKYITQVSFALDDVILFLDTHPCDKDALEYYQQVRQQRKEAMALYNEKYGPLQIDQENCESYWTWVESPWPWE